MVPRLLAPARAMRSRTCADVIQPCLSDHEVSSARGPARVCFGMCYFSASARLELVYC